MNGSIKSEKTFSSLSEAIDGSRGSPFQPVHGTGFGYGFNTLPRSTSEGEWPEFDCQLSTKCTTMESSSNRRKCVCEQTARVCVWGGGGGGGGRLHFPTTCTLYVVCYTGAFWRCVLYFCGLFAPLNLQSKEPAYLLPLPASLLRAKRPSHHHQRQGSQHSSGLGPSRRSLNQVRTTVRVNAVVHIHAAC